MEKEIKAFLLYTLPLFLSLLLSLPFLGKAKAISALPL
jgi:hypothetical protein